jgi:hypothetical protein
LTKVFLAEYQEHKSKKGYKVNSFYSCGMIYED